MKVLSKSLCPLQGLFIQGRDIHVNILRYMKLLIPFQREGIKRGIWQKLDKKKAYDKLD